METQFLSASQKGKLIDKLATADNDAVIEVFTELDRLECLVKSYEIVLGAAHRVVENHYNKKPREWNTKTP